jgi:sulfur relay protein TusC/DsrF
MIKKSILICFRKHPFLNDNKAKTGLILTLSLSPYCTNLNILFLNNGIHYINKNFISHKLHKKHNFCKMFLSFPYYGINNIYVAEKSLIKNKLTLDDLLIPTTIINENLILTLKNESNVIFFY